MRFHIFVLAIHLFSPSYTLKYQFLEKRSTRYGNDFSNSLSEASLSQRTNRRESVRFVVGRPGIHFLSRVIPKDLKMVFTASLLGAQHIEIMWRTSRKACLLCPWARHLTGCLHLHEPDRWWGQAVYSSWWPKSDERHANRA